MARGGVAWDRARRGVGDEGSLTLEVRGRTVAREQRVESVSLKGRHKIFVGELQGLGSWFGLS